MKKIVGIVSLMLLITSTAITISTSGSGYSITISGSSTGTVGEQYTFVITNSPFSGSGVEYLLGCQELSGVWTDLPSSHTEINVEGLRTNGWTSAKSIKQTWKEPGEYIICGQARKLITYDNGIEYYRYSYVAATTITISEAVHETSISIESMPVSDKDIWEGYIHQAIIFSSSNIHGVAPFMYSWDFDDGTISNEKNPTHIYQKEGTYQIKITSIDSKANIATDTIQVNIIQKNEPVFIYQESTKGFNGQIQSNDDPVSWTMELQGNCVFGKTRYQGIINQGNMQNLKLNSFFGLGKIDISLTINENVISYHGLLLGKQIIRMD